MHLIRCFRWRSFGGGAEGPTADGGGIGRSEGAGEEVEVRVTRSIMIKRPAGSPSTGNSTPPASPAGSTPPISPFGGGGDWDRFRRKSSSNAYERVGGGMVSIGSRDPTNEA
ncbi:auxin-repressed protein [Musa troglodytarum]|uniref:Auxin-repressed protein n=1 Tax=Musa troglodytarum TaxID=320322 RepID=A0A9E7FUR9_9LILI|nr:auxin-repressed protein [Musa troglodytarum]